MNVNKKLLTYILLINALLQNNKTAQQFSKMNDFKIAIRQNKENIQEINLFINEYGVTKEKTEEIFGDLKSRFEEHKKNKKEIEEKLENLKILVLKNYKVNDCERAVLQKATIVDLLKKINYYNFHFEEFKYYTEKLKQRYKRDKKKLERYYDKCEECKKRCHEIKQNVDIIYKKIKASTDIDPNKKIKGKKPDSILFYLAKISQSCENQYERANTFYRILNTYEKWEILDIINSIDSLQIDIEKVKEKFLKKMLVINIYRTCRNNEKNSEEFVSINKNIIIEKRDIKNILSDILEHSVEYAEMKIIQEYYG